MDRVVCNEALQSLQIARSTFQDQVIIHLSQRIGTWSDMNFVIKVCVNLGMFIIALSLLDKLFRR